MCVCVLVSPAVDGEAFGNIGEAAVKASRATFIALLCDLGSVVLCL